MKLLQYPRAALNWIAQHGYQQLDFLTGLAITCAGLLMALGVKAIPNIIETSITSLLFAYLWVYLLLVCGLLFVAGVALRNKFPRFAFTAELYSSLGLACGCFVYGMSAVIAFGLLGGVVTLAVCIVASVFFLKHFVSLQSRLSVLSSGSDQKREQDAS